MVLIGKALPMPPGGLRPTIMTFIRQKMYPPNEVSQIQYPNGLTSSYNYDPSDPEDYKIISQSYSCSGYTTRTITYTPVYNTTGPIPGLASVTTNDGLVMKKYYFYRVEPGRAHRLHQPGGNLYYLQYLAAADQLYISIH